MVRCDHGGLGHGLISRLPAVRHEDNVRTVNLLRVEPDIALERSLECQQVVLQVVFSRKHIKSVARTIMERLCLRRLAAQLLVARLLGREHTGLRELLAQLCKITLVFGFAESSEDTFQIIQLGCALLDLLCEHFLSGLGLVVQLEILLCVLLRRQPHI